MIKKNIFALLILTITCLDYSVGQHVKNGVGHDHKKVVFIAGGDSHGKGEHEYNGGVSFLAQKLKEGMPEIDTAVFHYGWPKDSGALRNASAIVLFCDGSEGHIIVPHLEKLKQLMNKGTGLVMIHFTLEIPKGNDGNRFRDLIGGYYETNWSVNPMWTPNFMTLPDHPIANGVKPFSIRDEWYYHMRFVDGIKNITPILKVLPPDSTLSRPDGTHSNNPHVREAVLVRKEPQRLAWAYNRPTGGRGFGFTGGHIHANWKNDSFRKLVLNAIVWTAQMDVPQKGVSTATPSLEELDRLTKQIK